MASAVGTTTALNPETTGATLAAPRQERSLWSNAWREFRRNKLAIVGLAYLVFLAVVAIFASQIATQNPIQSDVRTAGQYRQAAWVTDPNPMKTGSWDYPLGTDSIGRDVFSRLVYGTRISLVVGFIPMTLILLIGLPIGLTAGMLGGRVENLLMRMTDIVYAFPALLFFIIMMISFGDSALGRAFNGLVLLFITLSIINWTGLARLVRGETLALKEKEFVEAARASGAGTRRTIVKHILPNALGPIIVACAFIVPGAIISEAVLSFLGIGIRPSTNLDNPFPSSWGQMIQEGYRQWQVQPAMLIAPAIAIACITLAFTFVGDGLRDALDPRQQR